MGTYTSDVVHSARLPPITSATSWLKQVGFRLPASDRYITEGLFLKPSILWSILAPTGSPQNDGYLGRGVLRGCSVYDAQRACKINKQLGIYSRVIYGYLHLCSAYIGRLPVRYKNAARVSGRCQCCRLSKSQHILFACDSRKDNLNI